ncbi:hypothetical protein GOP47_0001230 [Adiantum capillus-veneris]|uniref:Pentatricopeptide repeat-containing protein n=1 Tax=Adiantum capillus-veneris TaxID=13818 RepID=A0A9D4ZT07_ADICA|nr:hypothetical protein GOP47_0001230 [Adiantum capillus-veneris]
MRSDELRLQSLANEAQLDEALTLLFRFATSPSDACYLSLLKACSRIKSLKHAKQLHQHIGDHRSHLSGLLGDYLVVTFANCGAAEDAFAVASALPFRTVYSWSAMVAAFADSEKAQEALGFLSQMRNEGIEPNHYTYVALVKACGSLSDLDMGKKLHADTCRNGYVLDHFVGNTLVSMYAKCGAVLEAENVFEALAQKDVVSWNAMLSAYVEQGEGDKALRLYQQMHADGIEPDELTFGVALQACTNLTEEEENMGVKEEEIKAICLEIGQALHADVRKRDFLWADIVIGNTLVSLYCKCGHISQAESMFVELPKRDVISWNAMLSAYVEHGQADIALRFYNKMQQEGVSPDQLTFVFALQACGIFAEGKAATIPKGLRKNRVPLTIGQAIHTDACRRGFASDVIIGNALLTMYGKCGTFKETEDLFSLLSERDTVSWNALLSVYVEQGWGERALRLYRHMQGQQVILDDLTLVYLLQACTETGNLALSMQLHFDIVALGYDKLPTVVTTLLHSYGNCASIPNGKAILDNLQEPDVVSWNALADGYAGKGNWLPSLHIHEEARLSGIQPAAVSFTSALLACCHCGRVQEGVEYYKSMGIDFEISPNVKHFGIIVDLMGRAGALKQVEEILSRMPMQADLTIWLSLLGACRTHSNVDLARRAFTQAVSLQPKHPTAYVLMANIYDDAGLEDQAIDVQMFRYRQGAWKRSCENWNENQQDFDLRYEKLPKGPLLYHILHQ